MEIQWTLVLFTVISGAGAWLFSFAALDEVSGKVDKPRVLEAIIAIVLLAVGGLLSVLHLSHPARILEALNHPTSGIFIEAVLLGLTAVAVIVYIILAKREGAQSARKVVAVIGLLLGVVFTAACGESYVMVARPAWNTIALPLAYFGTAAASGAGLYQLLRTVGKTGETESDGAALQNTGLYVLVAAAFGIVLALFYIISAGSSLAANMNEALPWLCALFAGLVIAAISGVLSRKPQANVQLLAIVAIVGSVLGSIALRSLMWVLGTSIDNFFSVL